ncbi:MAG: F0F1 ATP synthase subunit gamma, partial [Candidatus Marinimicrobia bacterium]|nr:F0F1 ATP synthase subunit gamma [Candidatus Neomarinimicrobiota bacterium]
GDDGGLIDAGQVLFEPSMAGVVASLVPRHLNVQVWRYLLESFASEQAARMTAMENATTNAGDVIDRLQLQYNKVRQTNITKEILDIVGGAEALRTAS